MHDLIHSNLTDPGPVASIENNRETHAFRRGETIFTQGNDASGLYCIQSGHVLLWHEDTNNKRTGFRIVGAGETMGYRSLFGAEPHAATAQALSNCNVCRYNPRVIVDLVQSEPKFALSMLKTLARDKGPSDALILRGSHLPVRTRLIRLLCILEHRYGEHRSDGELVLKLPLLRRDIALLIGARAESVTRVLKDLEREGIAKIRRQSLEVMDPRELRLEANLEGMTY